MVKPNVKSGWVGDVTLTLTSNRRKSERTLGTEPRGSTTYRVSVRPWRLRWLPALLTRGLSGPGRDFSAWIGLVPKQNSSGAASRTLHHGEQFCSVPPAVLPLSCEGIRLSIMVEGLHA